VCVRLEKKFPVIPFTNKKTGQEGTFCTFEFIDSEGNRMNAQAYNDICSKYHPELQMGNVYCFSRCSIRKAKSTRSPSSFEFVFETDMRLEERKAGDDNFPSFPLIKRSTVDEILDQLPNMNVNFVAFVKKADNLCNKKTKNGQFTPMREIEVFDDSTDETVS